MPSAAYFIDFRLDAREMALIKTYASAMQFGGKSRIYDDATERQARQQEDALIGILGEYVGSKHLFGSPDPFLISRFYANLWLVQNQQRGNGQVGDGGADVPGALIDFKTGLIRPDVKRPPDQYHLWVRPKERHPDKVYVMILVGTYSDQGASGMLIGWATDDMLFSQPDDQGRERYAVEVRHLHPLMPMPWQWLTVVTQAAAAAEVVNEQNKVRHRPRPPRR